jgi:hypothetical protein
VGSFDEGGEIQAFRKRRRDADCRSILLVSLLGRYAIQQVLLDGLVLKMQWNWFGPDTGAAFYTPALVATQLVGCACGLLCGLCRGRTVSSHS